MTDEYFPAELARRNARVAWLQCPRCYRIEKTTCAVWLPSASGICFEDGSILSEIVPPEEEYD
jgi:hypothetical protein